MKCPECLFENDVSARKCMNCGHKFSSPRITKSAKRKPHSSYISDYFGFRSLITPLLIKIIYLLGSMVVTFTGIAVIVSPDTVSNYVGSYGPSLADGVLLLLGGNLVWRMLCEGAILLFSLHDMLVSIDARYEAQLRRLS